MGQSHKNKDRLVNQWTLVDTLGRFQIYRNQHNQLAQKHIVKADPKIDQNDYLTAYHQRYLPDKPIVNAYDAKFTNKSKGLCQNSSTLTVFTQYIPHRLSDIQLLNHGQGMYVLSEALAGFSQLFNRVGPFQIHQDLIGFNQEGQVRVWHNPNFAENSVDNDRIILMSTLNPYDFDRKFSQNQQHDMVEDTFNAVARYTKFEPYFLNQAQYIKKMSFNQARQSINNQISRKAYYVPDHLFLADKNNIIQRSGVTIKNKHVYNPNKPRKGQKYPYFVNQGSDRAGQYYGQNYQQGQYGYNDNYGHGYDNYYNDESSSQSDSNYNLNNQGGYYNLNGQNYKIIGSHEVQGDHVNEQEIINSLSRNPAVYNQTRQYNQNQNYVQIRDGHNQQNYDRYYPQHDQYSDAGSQYSRSRANYHGEGHIVISDRNTKQHSNNRIVYYDQYGKHHYNGSNLPQQNAPQPNQDQVKIFSVGDDGRLVQENNFNNQINLNYQQRQPVYDQRQIIYNSRQTAYNPNQPQFPPQQSVVHPYPTNNPSVFNQSNIRTLPSQNLNYANNNNHIRVQQNYNYQPNMNMQTDNIHRHRIFEEENARKPRVVI